MDGMGYIGDESNTTQLYGESKRKHYKDPWFCSEKVDLWTLMRRFHEIFTNPQSLVVSICLPVLPGFFQRWWRFRTWKGTSFLRFRVKLGGLVVVINLATIDLPDFSVNDFAHIIWENTPNFPFHTDKRKKFLHKIVGEMWTRSIFQGAHGGMTWGSLGCLDCSD